MTRNHVKHYLLGVVISWILTLTADARTVQSPEWLRMSGVVSAIHPFPADHNLPTYFISSEPVPDSDAVSYQFVLPSQGLPGFIYQPAIWAYYHTRPELSVTNLDYPAMREATRRAHRKGNRVIPHVPGAEFWDGISAMETSQEGAVYINMQLLANDPPPDGFNFDALLNQGADLDAIRAEAENVMPVGNYVMLGEYGDPPSYNSFMGYLDTIWTPRPGAWADDLHGHHYLGYAIHGLDTGVQWQHGAETGDPGVYTVPLSLRASLGVWDALFWGGVTPWTQPFPGGDLHSEDLWKVMVLTKRLQAHADLHGLVKTPATLPVGRMLQRGLAVNLFDGADDTYFSHPDAPGSDKQVYTFKTGGYEVPFGDPNYYTLMPPTPAAGPAGDLFTAPYDKNHHWISAGVDGIWPTPVSVVNNECIISTRDRLAVYGHIPEPGETVTITRYRRILDVRRAAPARLDIRIDKDYAQPLTVELELRRDGFAPDSRIVSRPVVHQRVSLDLEQAFGISELSPDDVAFIRLYREHALSEWHIQPLLCDEVALDTPEAWAALPSGYAPPVPEPDPNPMAVAPGATWTSESAYTHATLEFRARLPQAGAGDTWIGFLSPLPVTWDPEEVARDHADMFNLLAFHYRQEDGGNRLQAMFDNASGQVEVSGGVTMTAGSHVLNTLAHWGDYLWKHGNRRIEATDPTGFHTYRIEWQRHFQRWYIDDQLVYLRRMVQNEPLPVTIQNHGDGDIEIEWLRVLDPLTSPAPFNPAQDIDNCVLWLTAGDLALTDGDPVPTWADASGQGNHLDRSAMSSGSAPTLQDNIFNGYPAVYFDGSTLGLPNTLSEIEAGEIFAVVTLESDSENTATLLRLESEGPHPTKTLRRDGGLTSYADQTGVDFGGGDDGVIRINGTPGTAITLGGLHLLNAGENSPHSYAGLLLGGNGTDAPYWKGHLAELIVYSHGLSVEQRNEIGRYLADKYGIQGMDYPDPGPRPPAKDDLILWLNAGDLRETAHGDPVSIWPDSSGNGHHLDRAGLGWGAAPVYQSNSPGFLNGKPSLYFNGSTLWTAAANPELEAREMFAVVTLEGDAENIATLLSVGAEGQPPFKQVRRDGLAEAYADDTAFDFGGGANGTIRIDGEAGTDVSYNVPHVFSASQNSAEIYTNLYLGWNVVHGRPWKGHVAEVLVYRHTLGDAERRAVGLYLSEKYGIEQPQIQLPGDPPTVTEGLAVWLDAGGLSGLEDGDPVTEWVDSSGNGHHLDRTGLGWGGAPTFRTHAPGGPFNGKPAVDFDVSTLWSEGTNPAIRAQEIFAVLSMDGDGESIATLLSVGREGVPPFKQIRRNGLESAYADDAAFDWGGGASGVIRINGTAGTEVAFGGHHILNAVQNNAATYSNLYLGWNVVHGRPWKGKVAEILIYDRALTSSEREMVHHHLGTKYNLNLTPPIPPSGLTIQNAPGYMITLDGSDGKYFDTAPPSAGSRVPENLALHGAAFASSQDSYHTTAKLNDGFYGNSSSWIGAESPAYAGILLDKPYHITSFAFGRDNGNDSEYPQLMDRSQGVYTIEFTSDGGETWFSVGTLTYTDQYGDNAPGGAFDPWYRHEYGVKTESGGRVAANGIRIQVPRGGIPNDGIAIDEIELYGTPAAISGTAAVGGQSLSLSWYDVIPIETYVLEISEDLTAPNPWSIYRTIRATDSELHFLDTQHVEGLRFYRLRSAN